MPMIGDCKIDFIILGGILVMKCKPSFVTDQWDLVVIDQLLLLACVAAFGKIT